MKNLKDNGLLILCNCPDRSMAVQLANQLLLQKLAGCVNVMPEMLSMYIWEGKQETATEVALQIKTVRHLYAEVERLIISMHPYQLPEIIAIPIVDGLPAYLQWIREQTGN
ncbi:divalent-cation tolerance protein CutA [Undibacterium oligocarboniphilum]|uniref:Divalent-cation tolerance protein CutA n=1 Tax=Undibacterium oligocarboniphilum TaxID=666702 RepID=A0A850QPS7_9BURK|nr:divalent-cation tolerance protein CutA [Undibacterium oligocarboniphilum]MBC3870449.1 divalent-cation tolerance protein CutA [Undibacterium oligocarboniphilum]NVO78750.1 divalent-cation tolerance protein CutA [Undibacterium oligocarboniphilum]